MKKLGRATDLLHFSAWTFEFQGRVHRGQLFQYLQGQCYGDRRLRRLRLEGKLEHLILYSRDFYTMSQPAAGRGVAAERICQNDLGVQAELLAGLQDFLSHVG